MQLGADIQSPLHELFSTLPMLVNALILMLTHKQSGDILRTGRRNQSKTGLMPFIKHSFNSEDKSI